MNDLVGNCSRLLCTCGASLVLACGDANGPTRGVSSIEITPDTPSVVLIGGTLQLTATVRDAAGNALSGRPVAWTSSDPAKATVSSTGLVTGRSIADEVAITATSGQATATTPLTVNMDLTGEWTFTEQLSGTAGGRPVTCGDTGAYRLAQRVTALDGTQVQVGTCTRPVNSWDNTVWPTPITDGRLSGTRINFRTGTGCSYEGGVTGPPAPRLSGTVSCPTYDLVGSVSGTWQAAPGGAPVASVAARWDMQTVVGGLVQLVAVPRDAAGHVLNRTVAWSSNNATVAQVSETGVVTALTTGSARITATSEGAAGSLTLAADMTTFSSVTAGAAAAHSCGLTAAGAAYCWGLGGGGQLGAGFRSATRTNLPPVAVAGGYVFATVSGGGGHSCAVTTAGDAYCWGDNSSGQLGDGSTTGTLVPVRVTGGQQFTSVTLGVHHSCGVTTANAVYCWGNNSSGQLGDGSTTDSYAPVPIAGGLLFQAARAGLYHTCGITTANIAYCWGLNDYGQLGDGSTATRLSPVAVAGGHAFATLGAGWAHSCGVRTDGAAYCWGRGGLIGNGSATGSPVPVPVAGGLSFTTAGAGLTAGQEHSCALTTAGTAYCWGNNQSGQLGDGSTLARSTPVPVSAGLSFATITVGLFHTCGITTAAVTFCWGLNASSRVGASTSESCLLAGVTYPCATTPVRVVGQPGAAGASNTGQGFRPPTFTAAAPRQ